MNTAKKIQPKRVKIVHLRPQNLTKRYAKCALIVAQSSLWNNREFSKKDLELLNQLMLEHFDNGLNPRKTFTEIIQRICLAKRYLSRGKGRYIAKPSDWLNIFYYNGLSGTAAWLDIVNEQRKTCPDYNQGIKLFSKAILSLIENPSNSSLAKHRAELLKNRQFDLVQVYANTLLNLQIQKP